MSENKTHLIAGIDPGTTTGIAILDIDALSLFSSRDLSLGRVIKHLLEFGRVSIIAVDVLVYP